MAETESTGHKWSALATVAVGSFMASVDNVICTISFPRLTEIFGTETSVVMWVTVAYLMVSTALLLVVGRLGDLFGRKRIYVLGFAVFTVGLIGCSISQDILQLILSRVVQGIGGGMIMAVTMAIITDAFPGKERGKAIGILEAVISVGVLVGPVLGGLLLDAFDWRAIFYARVPIGFIGIVMALVLLREQKYAAGKPAVDWWGAATLFVGLSCLLIFFNLGDKLGFLSLPALLLVGAGILFLILFVVQERRAGQPIVDFSLFRDRLFTGGNVSFFIMSFAFASLILLIPFFLMGGLRFSATQTGSMIAVASVFSLVIGPLSGWASDKIGTRILKPFGIILISISLYVFSRLGAASDMLDVALNFAFLGIALGIFNPVTQSSIMGAVTKDKLGTAAAMMNTIRQIGTSVGTVAAGVLFASRQAFHLVRMSGDNLEPSLLDRLAVVNGYQDVLLIAAIVCAIGILTTFIGFRQRQGT